MQGNSHFKINQKPFIYMLHNQKVIHVKQNKNKNVNINDDNNNKVV